MNNNEAKRKRIEFWTKGLGLAVVGFIVAPFVFIAIKGLIGLVVAATIGCGIVFFLPVVAAKFANWRLKALKAEATKNPVETLQNDFRIRQEKVYQFRDNIKNFFAEIENFANEVEIMKSSHPKDAAKFEVTLNKMRGVYAIRQQKYEQAKKQLVAYEQEIERANAIWNMAQSANRLGEAAGMTDSDFLQKIMSETALDSVQKNLNFALAELEVSLVDESSDGPNLVTDKQKTVDDYLQSPTIVTPEKVR